MILDEIDKARRLDIQRRGSSALLLPCIVLPLIQKPPLHSRDEFLRAAAVIGIVRFASSRKRHSSRVMEVIVPDGIQTIAAVLEVSHDPRVLWLVFSADHNRAAPRGAPRFLCKLGKDVFRRIV